MADQIWVDYSFARPDLADLKRRGCKGVIRYLSQGASKKILLQPERDAILALGLDLVLNFEWYTSRCNEGAAAGASDGKVALAQALALGYPQGGCIYFSHDTGVYDWPQIEAYFRSARKSLDGHYKIGAYGSYDLVRHLHQLGLIDYGWQTLAWSGHNPDGTRRRYSWAAIYQNGEALVPGTDTNVVSSTDIGSWLGSTESTDNLGGFSVSDLQTILDRIDAGAQHVINDLDGTKDRIAAAAPIIQQLDDQITALQKSVDTVAQSLTQALSGGSAPAAKAIATELAAILQRGSAGGSA